MPWFIYPMAAFLFSTTFHYFLFVKTPLQIYQLHLSWFLILNSLLFFTWLFTGSHETLWFLYVFFPLLIPLSIHHAAIKHKEEPHRYLRMHENFYLSLNLLLFFIWDNHRGYPWFIFALLSTSIPLVIHYCHTYFPKHWFYMHVGLFANVQTLLFFIYGITHSRFPWFIFPLAGGSFLLFLHYRVARSRENYSYIGNPPPTSQPYMPQINEVNNPTMNNVQISSTQPSSPNPNNTAPTYYYPQSVFPSNTTTPPQSHSPAIIYPTPLTPTTHYQQQ
jgi:hypothetical protein